MNTERKVYWGMVSFVAFLISTMLTISAQAREVYDTPSGRIVRNAHCLLVGNGSVARGPCTVGRNAETNNTLVVMNSLRMLIKRHSEEGTATAYIIEDDDTATPLASVVAVDECWVGHKFKFCAK